MCEDPVGAMDMLKNVCRWTIPSTTLMKWFMVVATVATIQLGRTANRVKTHITTSPGNLPQGHTRMLANVRFYIFIVVEVIPLSAV